MDFLGAKQYIIEKLKNELPQNLYYHNFGHTLDVLRAAEHYASLENIVGDDLLLLKTAALFHDSGFLEKYSHNEEASMKIVHEVLPAFNYNHVQIEIVNQMIISTEIPQKPKTLLAKILCDSDLDYLGRGDFFMTGIKLLREWNENGVKTSLREWYIQELYFLQQHEYFTPSAYHLRNAQKLIHLAQVKELLGEDGKK